MHLTLCELALDLVNNAVAAGADRIEVEWAESEESLLLSVNDNGEGMDAVTRERAVDPFYTAPGRHPGRRVGLGLPFMVQTAEETGGSWWLESESGIGTRVGLKVPADNVDVPATGDLAGTFAVMLGATEGGELVIDRHTGETGYTVSRTELLEALGHLGTVSSLKLIERYVRSQEENLWDG